MRCLESADVKAMVENHSYFGRLTMPLTMPVLKEILSPRLTQRKIDKTIAINLKGIWLCMQHEITEMLTRQVPSSTALRRLLVLKDCLHTLPQAWRNRIKKTAALEYAEQGTE
jgi:hypothetical protein